jgi:thiamine-phosphate pyrophosphorylase
VIPALHIVTDDEVLARDEFVSRAMGVLEAGGVELVFHLRGPRTAGRALYALARTLKSAAETFGCTLLANDRVDLALALGLSGAHLGQRSIPPEAARRILGPDRLLGLSVHGVEEAGIAAGGEVDFLLAGTIFSSPSHPGAPPGGIARLGEVRGVCRLPLLAIGGITQERVGEVLVAGAHGVAVRGGIWDAGDPTAATRGYLKALEEGRGR